MRSSEFDARFLDRVRKVFDEKGVLVKPNPVKWSSIVAEEEYYLRQLPFTIVEREVRTNLFEYDFKGANWTATIQIELTPVGVVNLAGNYYDRRVYDIGFVGDEDAFEADMISAKLML